MDTLGKRVLELRRVLNLQQKDMAKALGWAENAHSKLSIIEKDKSKPAYDFVSLLINAYPQINPVWILKGEGDMFVSGYVPSDVPQAQPKKEKPPMKGDGWAEKLIESLEAQLNDYKQREQDYRQTINVLVAK